MKQLLNYSITRMGRETISKSRVNPKNERSRGKFLRKMF
jgi:hypothetical protein